MYPQSIFLAKIRKIIIFLSENKHFYSREILLYIAWACYRNVKKEWTEAVFSHAALLTKMDRRHKTK